ncbi:MAG: hypothetical protein K0S26_2636 [Bacteroidota bacterium]|jgi:hypothetical protein|nr:hypothetical protein [Bacteroidota bacterium]
MKTLYIIIAFAFGLSLANAQISIETKIPSKVREAFTKRYPDVKNEKWAKEGGNYEAEFVVNKTESSAIYDSDGNFIESVVELKASELPKAVIDYVATNLNGKKIKEAGKITDAAGKISYKAEVGREDYIFDSDCSFVRKDDEKGKNDDQDY